MKNAAIWAEGGGQTVVCLFLILSIYLSSLIYFSSWSILLFHPLNFLSPSPPSFSLIPNFSLPIFLSLSLSPSICIPISPTSNANLVSSSHPSPPQPQRPSPSLHSHPKHQHTSKACLLTYPLSQPQPTQPTPPPVNLIPTHLYLPTPHPPLTPTYRASNSPFAMHRADRAATTTEVQERNIRRFLFNNALSHKIQAHLFFGADCQPGQGLPPRLVPRREKGVERVREGKGKEGRVKWKEEER